jgi:hypothetical protein
MLVDKIVAVVNDDIITLSNCQLAIQLYPVFRDKGESEYSFYKRILQSLINYKVIYQEYQKEFQLGEEDYEEVQIPIIKKVGSLEKLMEILQEYDLDWQDFKEFIKEKVVYEKVLNVQYQSKITIQYSEIERFYNQEYLPVQKQLELETKSLIEMTPLIEKYLRKQQTDIKLKEWLQEIKAYYHIEILLQRDDFFPVKKQPVPEKPA